MDSVQIGPKLVLDLLLRSSVEGAAGDNGHAGKFYIRHTTDDKHEWHVEKISFEDVCAGPFGCGKLIGRCSLSLPEPEHCMELLGVCLSIWRSFLCCYSTSKPQPLLLVDLALYNTRPPPGGLAF